MLLLLLLLLVTIVIICTNQCFRPWTAAPVRTLAASMLPSGESL